MFSQPSKLQNPRLKCHYTLSLPVELCLPLASLPSETSTESDFLSDYADSDAEEQWRESLQQLELLLTMVLVPFIGKYAGRKCAYWGVYFFSLIHLRKGVGLLTP